jgi:hypothetical protein
LPYATSQASAASTAMSGTTPVPSHLVPVTGLTDRANGTEIAMVQEIGTVLAGWAPPQVVSPISSARSCACRVQQKSSPPENVSLLVSR